MKEKNTVSLDALKGFKPLIKGTSKSISIFISVMGVIALAVGVWLGFFRGGDYVKTTAVITEIEEERDAAGTDADSMQYTAIVRYTVEGVEYTQPLDSWSPGYKVGKEVSVKYDPANPVKITSASPGFAIALIVIGILLIAFVLYGFFKNAARKKALGQKADEPLFGASSSGGEKTLYFLTDLGTAKGGCHIEDRDGGVLYEAKCRKFSLTADSAFDFIDSAAGSTKTHLVGKTATTSSDAVWALDDHSTFTLDSKDIWKKLHENGIRIETGLKGVKFAYAIYRDGEEIAFAVMAGKNPRGEEEKGVLNKIPFPGFFRITTKEENLDAIFLTLFAIGRTDMAIYS